MSDPLHAKVDALMKERGIDTLLLTGNSTDHPSFYYLVKSEKLENAVLVWKRGGRKLLVGSDMERDNAARTGLEFIPMSRTPLLSLSKKLAVDPAALQIAWLRWCLKKARARGKVALYGPVPLERSVLWLPKLKRELKADGLQLVEEKSPLLQAARELKTEDEIARIRAAGVGTKAAFDSLRAALAACRVKGGFLATPAGETLTIGELKRVVRLTLAEHGLVEALPSIIAQGEEGAVPHNAGTDSRRVVPGKAIVADIFPRAADGYFFDMTRTFCPGPAPKALQKLYDDVKEATLLAFEMYEPGIEAVAWQGRVQTLLEQKGYETLRSHPGTQVGFCHGLGHGLGLEVHEEPFIRAAKPKMLVPGHVITVEPGLYYPDKQMAVRIEDVAVVRDGRMENLTGYPMELEVPLQG